MNSKFGLPGTPKPDNGNSTGLNVVREGLGNGTFSKPITDLNQITEEQWNSAPDKRSISME